MKRITQKLLNWQRGQKHQAQRPGALSSEPQLNPPPTHTDHRLTIIL